ncbi:M14 family metallopeptidase [Flavobacterium rhizosphaerae]|uniref:M14 metallopeptidase family protein n=1 Tax=Flavobacterium rhizosphaerae TaxID=3163298 RepID=A0ABW8YVE1_9FLAO
MITDLNTLYDTHKQQVLEGRYITNTDIEPLLDKLKVCCEIKVAGYSVLNKPVYSIKAGDGDCKIFMWSQMHGNESTTTKAIFDFLNFFISDNGIAKKWREYFTFYILPILNPDGAELYTRANANKIDLNRDSVALSQPESRILRKEFEFFKPDFCFNMHDQRTIFGAGDTGKPATVSFLAPAYNEERSVNSVRQNAINLIVAMNKTLQNYIPGQVGRFDDSFNINCIGDMFQSLNVPTILLEAGHYAGDYERDITRKFIFFALFSGFYSINENVLVENKNTDYFDIPQNKVVFYDMIYKKIKINYENKEIITNFASQYKEMLFDKSVIFQSIISEIGNLEGFYAHQEYDGNGEEFLSADGKKYPVAGENADFFIGQERKFINGKEV